MQKTTVNPNPEQEMTVNPFAQEQAAEIAGVTRQSYSKWEQGETVPDIEKCDRLARHYGVTLDALLHDQNRVGHTALAPAPAGKHLWGAVTLGARGQIIIPKAAREMFDLKEGDRLIVHGDEGEGIALVKAEDFERKMQKALEMSQHPAEP